MDLIREPVHVSDRKLGRGFRAFRRSGKRRSNLEQSLLNLVNTCRDLRIRADTARKPERGVQLIDGSIGFDPKVGF